MLVLGGSTLTSSVARRQCSACCDDTRKVRLPVLAFGTCPTWHASQPHAARAARASMFSPEKKKVQLIDDNYLPDHTKSTQCHRCTRRLVLIQSALASHCTSFHSKSVGIGGTRNFQTSRSGSLSLPTGSTVFPQMIPDSASSQCDAP